MFCNVRRASLLSISVFLLLTLFCSISAAQQITGSISGSITDRSGSVIAGVAVKLTSENTAAVRQTTAMRS